MFKERLKTHHSAMMEGKKYAVGRKKLVEVLSVCDNTLDLKDKATVYIHVPFCSKICSFCNMRRSLQNPREDYHLSIIREIKHYAKLAYVKALTFEAIYFGGGTPTMLSTEALKQILNTLYAELSISEAAEITIETTITELTDDKIEILGENGVNRLSVGVQTFDDIGRRQMNRRGTGEAAYKKLKQLKEDGRFIVSMDLIYNYPNQTMENLQSDLDKIVTLDLDGFSFYSLINLKDTAISEAQNEANDEKMFFHIVNYMKKQGYCFLELTKMVKSDRYLYIINRHKGADTLPLGAGAGGNMNGLMLMNAIDIDEYTTNINHFEERKGMQFLPEYKEVTVFKGDIQTLKLPRNLALYKNLIEYDRLEEEMLKNGYISKSGQGFSLTDKGVFWGNTISRVLSACLTDEEA